MAVDFEIVDGGVAVVTINRPERLNAMDLETYHQLSEAWREVRDDPTVGAAVVTGAGDRAFSSGADVKSFLAEPPSLDEHWQTQRYELLNRGLEVWKPVVAAIRGYCFGGGLTLMLATDVRYATADATFALPEVKHGLVPGNGGTQRILEQLPRAIAMEWMLTGDVMDAETARSWGLLNDIVEPDELLPRCLDVARRITANPPLAVQAAKELALRARDVDRRTGLRMEQTMNRLLQFSEGAKRAPEAFESRGTTPGETRNAKRRGTSGRG